MESRKKITLEDVCYLCRMKHDINYVMSKVDLDVRSISNVIQHINCDCKVCTDDFDYVLSLDTKYIDKHIRIYRKKGECQDCLVQSGITKVMNKYKYKDRGIDKAFRYFECSCEGDKEDE